MSLKDKIQRWVLPIPFQPNRGLITYDAKDPDTKFPPIEQLRPPKGAPNVLIILIDDAGFSSSSAFGGPCQTPNAEKLAANLIEAETTLAQVLGMGPDDRVRAAQEERAAISIPVSEDASIEEALEHSPELRRLESDMQMKTLEIKGYRAARLPIKRKKHRQRAWLPYRIAVVISQKPRELARTVNSAPGLAPIASRISTGRPTCTTSLNATSSTASSRLGAKAA